VVRVVFGSCKVLMCRDARRLIRRDIGAERD